MNGNSTLAQHFEHGSIIGPNVAVSCLHCGASVTDWMKVDSNDDGLRPNQARHLAFHERVGY